MFSLKDKVIVITGGAGTFGQKHAEAVAEYEGTPIILDLPQTDPQKVSDRIKKKYKANSLAYEVDITSESQVKECCQKIVEQLGHVDVLINNAANNPKIEKKDTHFSRLEDFSLDSWNADLAVCLTGSFLCSKYFGQAISENKQGGSIINISSDLALISPDQRLYRKGNIPENQQEVKPISYSVVKAGLSGLTKYLATYWADKNVRCNAICPGGISNNQDKEFLDKLHQLIPLGRMANPDEYKGIIVFLASDAASYMNGAIISVDGGRVAW